MELPRPVDALLTEKRLEDAIWERGAGIAEITLLFSTP